MFLIDLYTACLSQPASPLSHSVYSHVHMFALKLTTTRLKIKPDKSDIKKLFLHFYIKIMHHFYINKHWQSF